ncbi:MAG: hypothetical protein B6226_04815 [Candidatus Cloacimonetes bacterium 4572_65]|nr:MAG: hypothetical protein B6226_04815 [Candidatus Cloacimonetes bacterium 4572_65]
MIDKRAIKTVNNVLERGETILIFPEGSRKSTKAKAGIGLLAMNTNCMIVPVHIENSNKALACFFGLKRLKIVVGKPIEPSYFKDWERNKENYRKLSSEVLDTINGLKDVN